MKLFFTTDRQTIIEAVTAKTVYFGLRDFKEKIVTGNCCFICGARPEEKEFNDEHIIPNWVLRRYKLHDKQINITPDRAVKYGGYVVPCCKECNTQLGKLVEEPVNELLTKSYNEMAAAIRADHNLFKLLYRWMCLLFFKTHLKDTYYPKELDRRIDHGKLGDQYDWQRMHHIHCMCRVHYTEAVLDPEVYGSLVILPTLNFDVNKFDYMDHMLGKTAMVMLGDVCIIAVLDDSAIVTNMIDHVLAKITGPLTNFQLKEFFLRMAHTNIHIEPRPIFSSTINANGEYAIEVQRPEECRIAEQQIITVGELLHFHAERFIADDLPNREQILLEIKQGKRAYILNEKGEFIQHKIDPAE